MDGQGRWLGDYGTVLRVCQYGGIRRLAGYSSLNVMDFYIRLGFKDIRRIGIPMGGDLVMPSVFWS